MKLLTLLFTSALLTSAFAAEPAANNTNGAAAPIKQVSEKAMAAHKEALAIEGMLKAKKPDLAAATARAEALHQHVMEMHAAAQAVDSGVPEAEKMKASVDVLKVLTENKAKQISAVNNGSDRERFRATAKNIAMRAEQILKTSRKIGG
jgi:hypothetical protein